MTTIYKYQIYCNDEEKFVSGWGATEPTTCYNNSAHSVNSYSVQIIQKVSDNQIYIKQENITTSNRFTILSLPITDVTPENSPKNVDLFFDTPTSVYSFSFHIDNPAVTDTFTIAINENTNIGLISQDVSVGATVIYLNPYVIGYICNKMGVIITDGTNTDDLGYVTTFNKNTYAVTVKTPTTHSFLASNTYCKITYYPARDVSLVGLGGLQLGSGILNATTVPANTTAKLYITNTTASTSKNFVIYLTCMV